MPLVRVRTEIISVVVHLMRWRLQNRDVHVWKTEREKPRLHERAFCPWARHCNLELMRDETPLIYAHMCSKDLVDSSSVEYMPHSFSLFFWTHSWCCQIVCVKQSHSQLSSLKRWRLYLIGAALAVISLFFGFATWRMVPWRISSLVGYPGLADPVSRTTLLSFVAWLYVCTKSCSTNSQQNVKPSVLISPACQWRDLRIHHLSDCPQWAQTNMCICSQYCLSST